MMSPTSLRVNPMLPAPMKATLSDVESEGLRARDMPIPCAGPLGRNGPPAQQPCVWMHHVARERTVKMNAQSSILKSARLAE